MRLKVNDPDTTDSISLDVINPVTVKKGSTVALTELTYDGYTFGGWFTDESLTNQFTSTSIITADTTLYAKWTKNSDANNTTITMNNVRYATIAAANRAYVINYGGKYSITLKDAKGNAVVGKKATFTLNGKYVGYAVTGANGVAKGFAAQV